MEHEMKLNNKKVFDFYKKTGLDFENTNVMFIDIMEKLVDASLNTNITANLFERFGLLESKIEAIGTSISKSQSELVMSVGNKMEVLKREYTDNLKLILSSNNVDHIAPLIKESNTNLIDKTSLLFKDIIPKGNESLTKELTLQFQQFNTSIVEKTNTMLSSSLDKKHIDDFFVNITQTINNSQQSITNTITSSEKRIDNRITENEKRLGELKELTGMNIQSQQTIQTNVSEMLKKFEKGVGKGSISEHVLYNILLALYPCASELDKVSDEQKETGDIMFQSRSDKPRILIENKDHESTNVPKQDVDKFLRDCNKHNCCGILLSQHRGIANKDDFEIKINGKNVLLYVHKVKFDVDKIKLAIDVVEHFKGELDILYSNDNEGENYIIESSVMENINNEYIYFKNQKLNLMKVIKDCGEKMCASLNELKLPNLDNYLCINFGSSANQHDNICKYCNKQVQKSLLQHYRYCKSKNAGVDSAASTEIVAPLDVVVSPLPPQHHVQQKQEKMKKKK